MTERYLKLCGLLQTHVVLLLDKLNKDSSVFSYNNFTNDNLYFIIEAMYSVSLAGGWHGQYHYIGP